MTEEQPQGLTPQQIADRLRAIDERLDRGALKMDQQAKQLSTMSAELKRNSATTNEVRELLDVGKAGLKVLGWLGAGAKWLAPIATMCVAVYSFWYAVFHGGQLPPKP